MIGGGIGGLIGAAGLQLVLTIAKRSSSSGVKAPLMIAAIAATGGIAVIAGQLVHQLLV